MWMMKAMTGAAIKIALYVVVLAWMLRTFGGAIGIAGVGTPALPPAIQAAWQSAMSVVGQWLPPL